MIQRKQSIFLFLAAVCMGLTFLLPLASYTQLTEQRTFLFRPYGLYTEQGVRAAEVDLNIPFQWLYGALVVALLAVIFLFKNRTRQMRFVRGLFMVILGAFVGQVFAHQSLSSYLGNSITLRSALLPGFFLPMAAVIMCWMAERGIRADEALVKSMDRLR